MLDIPVWHREHGWETQRGYAGEHKNNPAPPIVIRLHIVTFFVPARSAPLDQPESRR